MLVDQDRQVKRDADAADGGGRQDCGDRQGGDGGGVDDVVAPVTAGSA